MVTSAVESTIHNTPQPLPQGFRSEGTSKTEVTGAWWNENTFTLCALIVFGIYGVWAAAQNGHYHAGSYLSPFYSPQLKEMFPSFFSWVSFSPAFLVLWAPLGFRGTCYFYRRAVYRAAFNSPPACGVDTPKFQLFKEYMGETVFPFVLMNFHRYFLYFALILAAFHWYHVFQSLFYKGQFGFGVGSFVILLDSILLTLYVGSCHSLRHLIGGKLNNFSGGLLSKLSYGIWNGQSKINLHHWLYAWVSLFTVGFADLYIRLVSMGIWTDWNTWGASFASVAGH
jgi:hypothetical protein